MFAQPAESKGLELAIQLLPPDQPMRMRGDPFRLRQIVVNLVNNAIKFTPQGQVVVLARVITEAEDVGRIQLSVEDTGVGIAPEAREKVFEHFSQADGSTTRQFGGTGLGLAICKRLVELMGGKIGVDSALGKGSRFWVELVLPRVAEANAGSRCLPQLKDARVLVVDDNATNLEILKLQLESWQMQVRCAKGGAEALAAMRAAAVDAPFDLVILDMHMPGMDGLQLAHAIQADPVLAGTRRMMMTSTYSVGNSQERERAGILRCISKPVHQAELYEVVAWALQAGNDATSERRRAPDVAVMTSRAPAGKLCGRVLLAEDNLINQSVAKAVLLDLGLTLEVANNGEEALALITERDFDLVLMDCQMPVMDGFQATAALRQREAAGGRRLPVIALTANAMEGDRNQCLAAGMDDYLAKPYTRAQLEQTLKRWLPLPGESAGSVAIDAVVNVAEAAESTATIDREVLDRYREIDPAGGPGLARKIMQIYLDTAGAMVEQVAEATAAGDAEALRRAAHTLKSSSANLGATALSGLSKEMEILGREGRIAGAGPLLDAIRHEHAAVLAEIRAMLKEGA
jgi:CheY-like chemotaxis protein